jgi:hypothetical protein
MTPSVARFMRGLYRASLEPVPSALESLLTLTLRDMAGVIDGHSTRTRLSGQGLRSHLSADRRGVVLDRVP